MVNPNENAFPYQFEETTNQHAIEDGLTKREYFAAMALQGYASNAHAWEELSPEEQAAMAVYLADALIVALNER